MSAILFIPRLVIAILVVTVTLLCWPALWWLDGDAR